MEPTKVAEAKEITGISEESQEKPNDESQEESQEELKEESQEKPKDESQQEQKEEPQEEPKDEPAKRKKTAQERINELTRQRREAEREAAYWKSQAEQTKKPVQEDFDDFNDYIAAAIDHKERLKAAENIKKDMELRKKAALDVFKENATEIKAKNPDFDEVIERPVFTDTMKSVIFAMDNGPTVAYHIGKHPEIAGKFVHLAPEQQIYEIFKIEQSLLLSENKKKISSAPPPIEPVGITGTSEKDPSKMSTAEWMEWDRQREIAKLKHKLGG
jgi:molecular chaperone GrpE (heat shock protein)